MMPSNRTLSWRRCATSFVLLFGVWFVVGSLRAAEPAGKETPRKWYKGNLHTHSLWSDGNDFPEMICDWYKREGYHFLALSDHNILSQGEKWIAADAPAQRGAIGGLERYRERFGSSWVETREENGKTQVRLKTLPEFRGKFEEADRFLLVQSEEITDKFGSLPIHVNAANLRELIKPRGGNSVRETIANNLIAVQEQSARFGQPMYAHLNHPNFGYAVTAEDMAAVIQERFFEVYNGHPSVHHLGDAEHVGMERMWDIANTLRLAELKSPPLFGVATDDSHNYFGERGASPGRGWVQVQAAALTPEALIESLNAGAFYASSGVTLREVRWTAGTGELRIEVEPEPDTKYTTEFVGTLKNYDRTSKPVVNAKGEEIHATRRYSQDVGKVLAKVEGPVSTYRLTGEEFYVRAVVTSSRRAVNPSYDDQPQQAWTQPVGWEKHLPAR